MYIKLDPLDAQAMAVQAMLGMLRNEAVIRSAIASQNMPDDTLATVDTLIERSRKVLDYQEKALSPFGADLLRDLVVHTPDIITMMQRHAQSIQPASPKAALTMERLRDASRALRTSVEQARSVLNHITGQPVQLQPDQQAALYRRAQSIRAPSAVEQDIEAERVLEEPAYRA